MEGIDTEEKCPNGHSVHDDCLKEWLTHSKNCPLCSTRYSDELLGSYQGFLEGREQAAEKEAKEQLRQETREKLEKIAEKMVFLKFVEFIEGLIDKEQYDLALERLTPYHDKNLTNNFKAQNALFLKGKINYLRGRYDLAINSLFRLVKTQFEFPDAFLFLGKAYEELGLTEKAKWAFERAN